MNDVPPDLLAWLRRHCTSGEPGSPRRRTHGSPFADLSTGHHPPKGSFRSRHCPPGAGPDLARELAAGAERVFAPADGEERRWQFHSLKAGDAVTEEAESFEFRGPAVRSTVTHTRVHTTTGEVAEIGDIALFCGHCGGADRVDPSGHRCAWCGVCLCVAHALEATRASDGETLVLCPTHHRQYRRQFDTWATALRQGPEVLSAGPSPPAPRIVVPDPGTQTRGPTRRRADGGV